MAFKKRKIDRACTDWPWNNWALDVWISVIILLQLSLVSLKQRYFVSLEWTCVIVNVTLP